MVDSPTLTGWDKIFDCACAVYSGHDGSRKQATTTGFGVNQSCELKLTQLDYFSCLLICVTRIADRYLPLPCTHSLIPAVHDRKPHDAAIALWPNVTHTSTYIYTAFWVKARACARGCAHAAVDGISHWHDTARFGPGSAGHRPPHVLLAVRQWLWQNFGILIRAFSLASVLQLEECVITGVGG